MTSLVWMSLTKRATVLSNRDMKNRRFDVVLLDADETIYDFKRAEAYALEKTLENYDVEFTAEKLACYSEINLSLWKALERGKVSREELQPKRFEMFFSEIGISDLDFKAVNDFYLYSLSQTSFMIDGATEFVKELHKYCEIYIATNGLSIAQNGRLKNSPIKNDVDGMFISEEIGFAKPDKAYFEYIFSELNITDKSRVIILGDSLTSDMQGGKNAEITTCLFSRSGEFEKSDLCDYVISDYNKFFNILFE